MQLEGVIAQQLVESAKLKHASADALPEVVAKAVDIIVNAVIAGNKILLCGNGGSAADAQHIAAEFVGRFQMEGVNLPAVALTTDTSVLTALANDYGYENVFAKQVAALGKPGDILIAISTSGNSANVLEAVKCARQRGCLTIGMSGGNGGQLDRLVDVAIRVPSSSAARVQEVHITLGHIICGLVEQAMTEERSRGRKPLPAELGRPAKIISLEKAISLRERFRAEGQQVVFTNGCFQLLHPGHVRFLAEASELGDVLFVGLNGDASVLAIKGPPHPIVAQEDRAEVLAALSCVDFILIYDELTPEKLISELKPDIHCKGGDYAVDHSGTLPEARIVHAYGGRVEILPYYAGNSTTNIVSTIANRFVESANMLERSAL